MYKIDNKNLRANIKTLFLKTMVCFSGCLMSSASLQKLFCEVCSALKCSFEEFVREKVVFPSYSSAIFPSPSIPGFKLTISVKFTSLVANFTAIVLRHLGNVYFWRMYCVGVHYNMQPCPFPWHSLFSHVLTFLHVPTTIS